MHFIIASDTSPVEIRFDSEFVLLDDHDNNVVQWMLESQAFIECCALIPDWVVLKVAHPSPVYPKHILFFAFFLHAVIFLNFDKEFEKYLPRPWSFNLLDEIRIRSFLFLKLFLTLRLILAISSSFFRGLEDS